LIASGRPQLGIAQRLSVFLVTPTVTAVAVLNGLLGSLDVCCLWLVGLWHEPMHPLRGESAKNHPSLAAVATVYDADDGLATVSFCQD